MHVDVKCLPQMPDESQRRWLFVQVERSKSACAARSFPAAFSNGRIEEALRSHRFVSGQDPETTLKRRAWL